MHTREQSPYLAADMARETKKPIRSLGLSFQIWLWPWDLSAGRDADQYGGCLWLSVGPLCLKLDYGRP